MRTATRHWSRSPFTVGATVALLASFLIVVTGTAPAKAVGEVVSFDSASQSLFESATPTLNLVLTDSSPPTTAPVQVTVAVTGGTASPDDYDLAQTAFTFPSGSDSGTDITVPLTLVADNRFENDETIELTLTVTSGGIEGTQPTHTVTILNDDPNPSVSIDDAQVDENAGTLSFDVTRTGITDLTATAVATPASGSGFSGADLGVDFTATVSTVMIPPGGDSATETYTVSLVSDGIYEPDETFTVTLGPLGGGAFPGDVDAVGTILDDDSPPTLTINDRTVNEADGNATFTITRSGQTAYETEFDVATAGATATSGEDFTASSDTLTIPAGGATAATSFVVPITDDNIDEDTETYSVTVSDAPNATLSKAVGTGTIVDNDTAGVIVDVGNGVFVIEGEAPDTIQVTLTSQPVADVHVTIGADTNQLGISPSNLTFNASNWNDTQNVSVSALEDGIDEIDPHQTPISLAVTSNDPKYDGFPLSPVTAAIGDADALLVTIDGPSVGLPGNPARFTAMVNAGATGTITYDWTAFKDGNAITSGSQTTFQFAPSSGGAYIIQVIVGDDQGQNPAEFIAFRALADVGASIFGDDILWLAEQGITKGCNPPDNTMFCPTDVVTRAQMAAFLVRFLGLTDSGGGNHFSDDNGSIFEQDIAKIAAAGITKGCNPPANTHFCPEDPVTREQMAAFLVRALGLTDTGGGNHFSDDNGSIFEQDIAKIAAAGITKGCNPPANTMFCPTSPVTREQMAAFIHRASSATP
jgi:hypothetical protein